MHRLRVALLGKDICADGVDCLVQPELREQPNNLWVDVNRPYLAALRCVQIDAFLRRVAEVSSNRDCASLNFGALNRAGGWRRLNVALSRARTEVKVFSSLAAEQVDLSCSSAKGVAVLSAFLGYTQSGQLEVDEKMLRRTHSRKTGIAETVCVTLKEKGYAVQCAVGKSEYKVDIASKAGTVSAGYFAGWRELWRGKDGAGSGKRPD